MPLDMGKKVIDMRHNILRKILFGLSNKFNPRMELNEANTLLQKRLLDDAPLMVARFGAAEIKSLIYSVLPHITHTN